MKEVNKKRSAGQQNIRFGELGLSNADSFRRFTIIESRSID